MAIALAQVLPDGNFKNSAMSLVGGTDDARLPGEFVTRYRVKQKLLGGQSRNCLIDYRRNPVQISHAITTK